MKAKYEPYAVLDDEECKEVFRFDVAYVGWECDSIGSVVETRKGKRHIILTNHGMRYIAKVGKLRELIGQYEQLINDTEEAIITYKAGK